ncbi:hypothetical protein AAHE18_20G140600 [Arachis hypogaea]|nr:uncharacterized protein DS421_20g697660 [Arachis hypogaea]
MLDQSIDAEPKLEQGSSESFIIEIDLLQQGRSNEAPAALALRRTEARSQDTCFSGGSTNPISLGSRNTVQFFVSPNNVDGSSSSRCAHRHVLPLPAQLLPAMATTPIGGSSNAVSLFFPSPLFFFVRE